MISKGTWIANSNPPASCSILTHIDEHIAVSAADLFIKHKLPLADSIIYAVTLAHNATLWTQDDEFKDLPNVKYFPKKKNKSIPPFPGGGLK